MTKQRREKTQINKIKDKKEDITTNTNETQRIIREYSVLGEGNNGRGKSE
jgi:hypothetical protein